MRENYTIISFLLVFIWSFFGGPGVPVSSAQSGCGINVDTIIVQSEREIDGVLHKKVQVLVKNPNPGIFNTFFYLIDGADRDSTTKPYTYGSLSDEFWIPIDAEKITFHDFNNPQQCYIEHPLDLTANICTFSVSPRYVWTTDCYDVIAELLVPDSITLDSIVWFFNGGNVPVHNSKNWVNIPAGSYEVYLYNDKGCESTAVLSHCTMKTNAGENKSIQYCVRMDDTINLFNIVDPDVDSGGFFTETFAPVDSLNAIEMTFQQEDVLQFYYIAPAFLDIPDTSLITIEVRDCSVCAYQLISAERHCLTPGLVDVVIGGGSPLDSTFLVTYPDGFTSTQTFFIPFQVDFPNYQDSFRLDLHYNTPTGVCDSTMMIGPVASPMIRIATTEIVMDGDSVGIEVAATQGAEPYHVDVFVGSQQKFAILQEGVITRFDFVQSVDTAFIMVMDDQGCMSTDTLILLPDCITPGVSIAPATCGEKNGVITVDSSAMPAGSRIIWLDTNLVDVWHLTGLAPGTYYYSITYDDCQVEGNATIGAPAPIAAQVLSSNECLLDGEVRFYLEDSAQVRGWIYDNEALPHFSGTFPVNEDHVLHIQTMDGCRDSVTVRVDEPYWLDQVGYQQPNNLSAVLGVDFSQLSDFGWLVGDSVLCHPCGDYESETMLTSGVYTFFAEQGSGCRRDTTIRVNQNEHQFLMPNVITPGKSRNNHIQIFDPLNQMASIMEFKVYDRFGNVLYEQFDFYPDDDASLAWPHGLATELPDIIVCVAKIKCVEGDEVFMAQDVLILR